MKYILYILLVFLNFQGLTKELTLLQIDSLPPSGKLIDSGWKWKQGDNLDWAKPEFDDHNWSLINPAKYIQDFPYINHNRVFWLRCQFYMEVNPDKAYSFLIRQSGASQIYLNGKKIKDYGTFLEANQGIKAFDPMGKPLLISPIRGQVQTLSVRYIFQPGLRYYNFFNFENYLFKVNLSYLNNGINKYSSHRPAIIEGFNVGIYLVFFVLHIILFLFYPKSKSNLLFALWAFFCTLANIGLLFPYFSNFVEVHDKIVVVSESLFTLANIFLAGSVCLLMKERFSWLFLGILLSQSFELLLSIKSIDIGNFITSIILWFSSPLLLMLIAYKGLRKKENGARIVLIGSIMFIVFWIFFSSTNLLNLSQNFKDITFHLAFFVFPLSISLVLGLEFRFINTSLNEKLVELEALSIEKQKILGSQNEELERQVIDRTRALTQTLEDLKATQSKLIHSEKMASLGELTAGIAHEIQNPLNFVNNFSELNTDLLEDAELEIRKGHSEETLHILKNIRENESKIKHHGKRAETIVKRMLQYSRKVSDEKELTDINIIANNCFQLSYQEHKTKNPFFKVEIKTEFDKAIKPIQVLPIDISSVFINLFNNAFYSVNDKWMKNPEGYDPMVLLSTQNQVDKIIIKVSDNGVGISESIKQKIFQPFFTTKPAGQGTGLGLSLSYEIIKAHKGEIRVESREGFLTDFIVELPKS